MRVCIYKASQPRGRASGSRAYGRQEMQGVIFKSTRHECSAHITKIFVKRTILFLLCTVFHRIGSYLFNRRLVYSRTTAEAGIQLGCSCRTMAQ